MAEIVNVPVPVDRLQEVYKVLARRPGADAEGQAGAREQELEPEPWDFEALRGFWEGSDRRAKELLAYLAARPDENVYIRELRSALDIEEGRGIGGVIGALQRRSRNHFHRDMPFRKHPSPEYGVIYVMPGEIAFWVQQLQEEDEQADDQREPESLPAA